MFVKLTPFRNGGGFLLSYTGEKLALYLVIPNIIGPVIHHIGFVIRAKFIYPEPGDPRPSEIIFAIIFCIMENSLYLCTPNKELCVKSKEN